MQPPIPNIPWYSTEVKLLWAAVVSAAVSAVISYSVKRREISFGLRAAYEQEERRKLRELIGRYHGRCLNAAHGFSHRMFTLYRDEQRKELDAGGVYVARNELLLTTVHRFLTLCALIQQFEREAIFIDARIAERGDLLFRNYLNALWWAFTSPQLFEEQDYDAASGRDHLPADVLRLQCELFWDVDKPLSLEAFGERIRTDRSFDPTFRFFDVLEEDEPRLRWGRLTAGHLLLLAFINIFGYETQRTGRSVFVDVARKVMPRLILKNLVHALPRLGLEPVTRLRRALAAWTARVPGVPWAPVRECARIRAAAAKQNVRGVGTGSQWTHFKRFSAFSRNSGERSTPAAPHAHVSDG